MSQLIIHENDFNGVAICYPAPEALDTYTITEIALKDTPTGKPFWVLNQNQISDDKTFFDAWEIGRAHV